MASLNKEFLKRFGFKSHTKPIDNTTKPPVDSLVLIHIGKCGGRTLKISLKNAKKNTNIHSVHIKKPPYRKDLKYIIVARNPITRLKSAFRWRHKLVVRDASQRNRFKGEYEVLIKYQTLNNLAEALYDTNGLVNKTAHQEIRKIHHVKEDIAFYLRDLLNKCSPQQIVAVLMQEDLDADIFRVFGYKNRINEHNNPDLNDESKLSEAGQRNLMEFFREDYEALIKLYSWGKIERELFIKII